MSSPVGDRYTNVDAHNDEGSHQIAFTSTDRVQNRVRQSEGIWMIGGVQQWKGQGSARTIYSVPATQRIEF